MTFSARNDPPATLLVDPFTGKPTGVSARVFGDGIFILDAQGETLANFEVVVNAEGTAELVAYLRDSSELAPDDEDPQWSIYRIPAVVPHEH